MMTLGFWDVFCDTVISMGSLSFLLRPPQAL
jgi:hypothetical protein